MLCNNYFVNIRSFEKSVKLHSILKSFETLGKYVAAICASPIVLKAAKIGTNKRLTSYPSFEKEFAKDYEYLKENVVIDGKMITSRGPGTSFEFAFTLVQVLVNQDIIKTLKSGMLVQ